MWILTVSADGSVPMAYRLADGNTSDDPTHIPTWDGLVRVLGRLDFLYVADSKLCSGQAMRHIDGAGGRFVTVLPRTRGEDKWFRDWIGTNQPSWAEGIRLPRQPDRRPGPGLVHLRRAAALGRGVPDRLGPLRNAIADDAAGDGCFPLITNDRQLTNQEALVAYRYQPNLERRHHLLKSVQDADPVWLRDPARIEAIFCCQFLALLVGALIEYRSAPP